MSRSEHHNGLAVKPQNLAAPDRSPVTSRIKEIHGLGSAMESRNALSGRSRTLSPEIVHGLSIIPSPPSLAEPGRRLPSRFTDVRFTTIAEAADPDVLMHQTSRYFSALTEGFPRRRRTIDKFIGDAVMGSECT
jgi:adenylate cyclase